MTCDSLGAFVRVARGGLESFVKGLVSGLFSIKQKIVVGCLNFFPLLT